MIFGPYCTLHTAIIHMITLFGMVESHHHSTVNCDTSCNSNLKFDYYESFMHKIIFIWQGCMVTTYNIHICFQQLLALAADCMPYTYEL